jgi:hypothetical protein
MTYKPDSSNLHLRLGTIGSKKPSYYPRLEKEFFLGSVHGPLLSSSKTKHHADIYLSGNIVIINTWINCNNNVPDYMKYNLDSLRERASRQIGGNTIYKLALKLVEKKS